MTTEEIRTIKQQIQGLEDRFDDFVKSIDDFHERVDRRNSEQDAQLKDIKEKTDTIYTAVAWLGTTGRIIKYTAGLFTAIATVCAVGWAFVKFIVLEAIR